MQIASVILLIASLLICPYRCLGCVSSECAPEEPMTHCSCCHKPPQVAATESTQGGRQPASPDDDCECGNCLCHGAIRGDGLSSQDLVTVACDIVDLPALVFPADVKQSCWQGIDGPPLASVVAGRFLHLVLQSLQV